MRLGFKDRDFGAMAWELRIFCCKLVKRVLSVPKIVCKRCRRFSARPSGRGEAVHCCTNAWAIITHRFGEFQGLSLALNYFTRASQRTRRSEATHLIARFPEKIISVSVSLFITHPIHIYQFHHQPFLSSVFRASMTQWKINQIGGVAIKKWCLRISGNRIMQKKLQMTSNAIGIEPLHFRNRVHFEFFQILWNYFFDVFWRTRHPVVTTEHMSSKSDHKSSFSGWITLHGHTFPTNLHKFQMDLQIGMYPHEMSYSHCSDSRDELSATTTYQLKQIIYSAWSEYIAMPLLLFFFV